MSILIASVQLLVQCRLLWYVGQDGVSWTRAGWAVGSACLGNLAARLLGISGTRCHVGLTLGAALLGAMVPSFDVWCMAMPADLAWPAWRIWEVGRCLF